MANIDRVVKYGGGCQGRDFVGLLMLPRVHLLNLGGSRKVVGYLVIVVFANA